VGSSQAKNSPATALRGGAPRWRETRVGVAAVLQPARRWPICGVQIADGQSDRALSIV
jgi:hypothetical protein